MGRIARSRRIVYVSAPGKRREEDRQNRWKDSCKKRCGECGLKEEDALDRTKWKNDIQCHSSDPRRWEHRSSRRRVSMRPKIRYVLMIL